MPLTIEPRLKDLVESYITWLHQRISLEKIPGEGDGWHSLRTPFLDKHNDFIEIYVKVDDDQVVLSDDGYTLDELEISGCSINSHKRREILRQNLAIFGIEESDGALVMRCNAADFSARKHMFLQGLIAIGDMMYLSSPTVVSVFKDDVEAWLEKNDIRFTPTIKLTGKSGFDHVFDFVIPKSKKQPERLVRIFSRPNRERAESMVFSWVDTKEIRPPETQAYAILNDAEPIPDSVYGALSAYGVNHVTWRNRDEYAEQLAA